MFLFAALSAAPSAFAQPFITIEHPCSILATGSAHGTRACDCVFTKRSAWNWWDGSGTTAPMVAGSCFELSSVMTSVALFKASDRAEIEDTIAPRGDKIATHFFHVWDTTPAAESLTSMGNVSVRSGDLTWTGSGQNLHLATDDVGDPVLTLDIAPPDDPIGGFLADIDGDGHEDAVMTFAGDRALVALGPLDVTAIYVPPL